MNEENRSQAELRAELAELRTKYQDLYTRGQLYHAIVTSSDDAIVSKDLKGVITGWNKGAERIFGYTAEEMIGRSVLTLIPEELQGQEVEILEQLKSGARIDHIETQRMRKDGSLVDLSLTISPIKDESGTIIGASKVARDITSRKASETALREADRRKDEFLATLAHELRNPLAPLNNALQLLEMTADDPAASAQARSLMNRQVVQMVHLVNDLMDVSRISRGVIILRKERLLLNAALEQAVEAVRPLMDGHGHRLVTNPCLEDLRVEGDHTRLVQIFSNLLTNAAKYTTSGGVVTLACQREGEQVMVSVTDTGMGIEPGQLSRVFEMFTQLDSSPNRSQTGLGIGLSIARQLVHLHGGSIAAHSEGLGKGSTFRVHLPLAASVVVDPAVVDARTVPGSGLRVLLVDDNVEAAASLSLIVRKLGHFTRTLYKSVDALPEFERFKPQLIVLDIGMPHLDGYELCRQIRTSPGGSEVFIAALTGWGKEEDKERARSAGFDMHIVKPMGKDTLLHLLETAGGAISSAG